MLVVAVVAVTLVLAGTLAVALRAHVARTHVQAAADLAALAAAQSLVVPTGLTTETTGRACPLAVEVADRHGARVVTCVVGQGGVVEVVLETATSLGAARATARAGPVDASGPR